jgi:hypothetical protein
MYFIKRLHFLFVFLLFSIFVLIASSNPTWAANAMPVGGGSTDAGFQGLYFSNTDFAGEPAFQRRDVRIDFDWKEGVAGKGLPVGGSTTPGMKDFSHDDYSIRWKGQIVPRFSEEYTFHIIGQDGVRFRFRPDGGDWLTLVDSLENAQSADKSVGALEAGKKYEIIFEYVDRANTGASVARLEWSSPSTPREVIEPLSFAQICGHQAAPQTWLKKERAGVNRKILTHPSDICPFA